LEFSCVTVTDSVIYNPVSAFDSILPQFARHTKQSA
jgi:hypothetical protein